MATESSGCRGGAPGSSSASTLRRCSEQTRRPLASCSVGTASPPGGPRATTPRPTVSGSSRPPGPTSTHGAAHPFGEDVAERRPLPPEQRRTKAAALAPFLRGIASCDQRMIGHFSDQHEVLEFVGSAKLFVLAELGTSCPDHFLRTKVKPLVLDLPSDASIEECV